MGKNARTCITWENEMLDVVGYYSEAQKQDYDTPPISAEFDIEKILYKGVNVYPILSVESIENIEVKCLLNLGNK